MDKKFDGTFSLGFFSLQLQLQNLLEEAGGDKAVQLLDAISNLDPARRGMLLDCFTRAARNLAGEDLAGQPGEKLDTQTLEDSLYNEILSCATQVHDNPRLEVVCGGKESRNQAEREPISLEEVRKARRSGRKTILN